MGLWPKMWKLWMVALLLATQVGRANAQEDSLDDEEEAGSRVENCTIYARIKAVLTLAGKYAIISAKNFLIRVGLNRPSFCGNSRINSSRVR